MRPSRHKTCKGPWAALIQIKLFTSKHEINVFFITTSFISFILYLLSYILFVVVVVIIVILLLAARAAKGHVVWNPYKITRPPRRQKHQTDHQDGLLSGYGYGGIKRSQEMPVMKKEFAISQKSSHIDEADRWNRNSCWITDTRRSRWQAKLASEIGKRNWPALQRLLLISLLKKTVNKGKPNSHIFNCRIVVFPKSESCGPPNFNSNLCPFYLGIQSLLICSV